MDTNAVQGMELEQREPIITPGQLVMKRFLRNKLAIVGMVVLVVMIIFCYFGPMFYPYGEIEMFYVDPVTREEYSAHDKTRPSSVLLLKKEVTSPTHILGTNQDGQDILARLMYGGRISILIGFVCVLIEILLGVLLGGISGYYGKWIDMLIMRIVDIVYCIPYLPVVLILSAVLLTLNVPNNQKIYWLIGVIALLGWVGIARMVRGQILSLREQEYMIAAEAAGIKARNRIFKHLIPNVMPQIIVMATLGIGSVILFESALSYLGFGVPLPYSSWGNMVGAITDNTDLMIANPNIWIPPGICILVTVMAFNFVGDGLRDAFDPKMKR